MLILFLLVLELYKNNSFKKVYYYTMPQLDIFIFFTYNSSIAIVFLYNVLVLRDIGTIQSTIVFLYYVLVLRNTVVINLFKSFKSFKNLKTRNSLNFLTKEITQISSDQALNHTTYDVMDVSTIDTEIIEFRKKINEYEK